MFESYETIFVFIKIYIAKIKKRAMLRWLKKMLESDKENINIFALTDCHQEARRLCCLLSEVITRSDKGGQNTLVCDGGDLFKGIYNRQLCVNSYLQLRQKLPQAQIILALGNNDFGFNNSDLTFLKDSIHQFKQANIHVLCANLIDEKTGDYPNWIEPFTILEINNKKIMVIAFCINQIRLQKYGLQLLDIEQTFLNLVPQIKHIAPDALIVLNHALRAKSLSLAQTAHKAGIDIDLLIGGHEHSVVEPIYAQHIYYPLAYARNMLLFRLTITKPNMIEFIEEIDCKSCPIHPDFNAPLDNYETKVGLNIPVAHSVLNLERDYSNPSSIGTFITDKMRSVAKADIGFISTGFICHALRFEAGKMLTHYNIERAFSADIPLQTVVVYPAQLREIFDNALKMRYTQYSGNTRFLQCSQNVAIECLKLNDNTGKVKQIYINGIALLKENGESLHPEDTYLCAIDPFIGSGELGFDVLRTLPKETLLHNNHLVKIKDLFTEAISEAEQKYAPGSIYPTFKLRDL